MCIVEQDYEQESGVADEPATSVRSLNSRPLRVGSIGSKGTHLQDHIPFIQFLKPKRNARVHVIAIKVFQDFLKVWDNQICIVKYTTRLRALRSEAWRELFLLQSYCCLPFIVFQHGTFSVAGIFELSNAGSLGFCLGQCLKGDEEQEMTDFEPAFD